MDKYKKNKKQTLSNIKNWGLVTYIYAYVLYWIGVVVLINLVYYLVSCKST